MATDSTRKFANLAFFRSFGEGKLDELMLYSELKNFDNGQIIFKEGDPAEELYVIVTGKVEILKSILFLRSLLSSRNLFDNQELLR